MALKKIVLNAPISIYLQTKRNEVIIFLTIKYLQSKVIKHLGEEGLLRLKFYNMAKKLKLQINLKKTSSIVSVNRFMALSW